MRLRGIAFAVLGVVAALGVVVLGVQLRRSARTKALASELDAASRPLIFDCRWDRPVTAGATPRDCNAAAEERAAVKRLFADIERDLLLKTNLLGLIEQDQAPPAGVAAFLASHGPALAALHEATLCSWACARDVSPENYHQGTTFAAVQLLLTSAAESAPPTCFSQALDALRIELDRYTGVAGAGAYSTKATRETAHAIRHVLLRCAARADAATLRASTTDAATIAMTPPPVGDGMATLALTYAVSLVEDTNGARSWGQAMWVQRGVFLDAASDLAERIPALREFGDADWPEHFERLPREAPPKRTAPFGDRPDEYGGATVNETLDVEAIMADELRWYGHRDRDLRLLVAALAAMRDRAVTGAFPPSGPEELAAPTLRDPLTGEPFGWSTGPGDGQATLVAHAGRGEGAEAIALP
jgi:hypothetical protein